MLHIEDRCNWWEQTYEAVHKLFSNVEDALNWKFAPYKKNGVLVEADKDTPEVKELFDMLADLDAYLKQKLNMSRSELRQWEDKQASGRMAS